MIANSAKLVTPSQVQLTADLLDDVFPAGFLVTLELYTHQPLLFRARCNPTWASGQQSVPGIAIGVDSSLQQVGICFSQARPTRCALAIRNTSLDLRRASAIEEGRRRRSARSASPAPSRSHVQQDGGLADASTACSTNAVASSKATWRQCVRLMLTHTCSRPDLREHAFHRQLCSVREHMWTTYTHSDQLVHPLQLQLTAILLGDVLGSGMFVMFSRWPGYCFRFDTNGPAAPALVQQADVPPQSTAIVIDCEGTVTVASELFDVEPPLSGGATPARGRVHATRAAQATGSRRGLPNDGNTCYLGATLQALLHCPVAVAATLYARHECVEPCSVCCFAQSKQQTEPGSERVSVAHWQQVVEGFGLQWGRQEDAGEFCGSLLEDITRHLTREAPWVLLEAWTIKETYTCQCLPAHCSEIIVNEFQQSTNIIEVRLEGSGRAATVEDLVASASDYTTVDPEEHKRCCAECGSSIVLSKKLQHDGTSDVVIVRFNRYAALGEKCARDVIVTQQFDVAGKKYAVESVVAHRGHDLNSGHYVCWVLDGSSWLEYDDATVRRWESLSAADCSGIVLLVGCLATKSRAASDSQDPSDIQSPSACAEVYDSAGQAAECHVGKATVAEGTPEAGPVEPEEDVPERSAVDYVALFSQHVDELLQTYLDKGNARQFLASLPSHPPQVSSCTEDHMLYQFEEGLASWRQSDMGSRQAVTLQTPLWRTAYYPLAVLCEALSRATSMPAAFYLDSYLAMWSSLLHPQVHVQALGFASRARFWVANTAEPGSGKSPALDPLRAILVEVMEKNKDLAPGHAGDQFHCQQGTTHAVAIDRLNATKGSLLMSSAEAGPLLCPAWPTSGKWEQATHVNFYRFLDSANGGQVYWEKMEDRRGKKAGKPATNVALNVTNVTFLFIQQLSVFARWWALAESRYPVGMTARFSLGFGTTRHPGPTSLKNFANDVAFPILADFFKGIMTTLGPRVPIHDAHPLQKWRFSAAQDELMKRMQRVCHDLSKDPRTRRTLRSGLNKCSYWIAQQSLYVSIHRALGSRVLRGEAVSEKDLQPGFEMLDLFTSMEFFWMRYAFGLSVIDADIARAAWVDVDRVLSTDEVEDVKYRVGEILRHCVGHSVTLAEIAGVHKRYRRALSADAKTRADGLADVVAVCKRMETAGFGRLTDASLAAFTFDKYDFKHLPAPVQVCCLVFLRRGGEWGAGVQAVSLFLSLSLSLSHTHTHTHARTLSPSLSLPQCPRVSVSLSLSVVVSPSLRLSAPPSPWQVVTPPLCTPVCLSLSVSGAPSSSLLVFHLSRWQKTKAALQELSVPLWSFSSGLAPATETRQA